MNYLEKDQNMSLKIHGEYKIEVAGEIFILRLYNSWNEDCSKAFLNDYMKTILEHGFKQFGVLADLRKLEGATPGAIQLFQSITEWTREHGQIARALIHDSGLNKFIAQMALEDELFPAKTFNEEKTALAWLEEQGLRLL